MKSRNIIESKGSSDASNSRASLSKLQFDFRNAKPAFVDMSHCMSASSRMKPDSQQTKLSFGEVERNRVGVVKHDANVGDAEISSIGEHLNASTVQVDDVHCKRSDDASDVAAVRLHTCSTATTSQPTDRNNIFVSFSTVHTQATDSFLSGCIVPGKNVLPPNGGPLPLFVSVLNEQIEFHSLSEEEKPKCIENDIAKNKAGVRAAGDIVLKQLSVCVNKVSLHQEKKQSTGSNVMHSAGSGISSQSLLPSRNPAIFVHGDASRIVSTSHCKSSSLSADQVRKELKSKNFHPLVAATSASMSAEAKFKDSGPTCKVAKTPKRRQKIKSELDDWSTRKKLLLMPTDTKCSNSYRSRKQNSRVKRNIFPSKPKRKCCQSMSMTEMELPDVNVPLKSSVGVTEVPGMSCCWASEVDDNTVPQITSRKWCLDITGADLSTDSDVVCVQKYRGTNNRWKSLIAKTADRNISQLMSEYATDSQFTHPDFSSSQETPPPSVASDSSSSCDESDQCLKSNADDHTNQKPSSSQWLQINTKLAHYIDGRCFNRLVNGISLRIPATLTQETVGQFGEECLCLKKLTKRDLKELQNQVRLEEIYHRRAKKTVLFSPLDRIASGRHNYSMRTLRSAARLAAEFHSTDDNGDDDDVAAETSLNQGASFTGINHLAAESNDTVSYLFSDCQSNKTAEPSSFISEPVAVYKSELLQQSNIVATSPGSSYSCIDSSNGSKHQEIAGIRGLIQRQICADENEPQLQDQASEPTSITVNVQQQRTSASSNSSISEKLAVSDSLVYDDHVKDFSCPKSMKKVTSLQKRSGVHFDTNKPQHTVMDAVSSRTNMSGADAVETADSEYIAAIALASLSVATTSMESALNLSQSNEECKVTETDTNVAVVAKLAVSDLSPHYSTEQSCTSETVQKPSGRSLKHNSDHHDMEDADRRRKHVSTQSTDKHSSRSSGGSVNSSVHRSRGHGSHSAKVSSDEKRIMGNKEKSSVTTIKSSDHSRHVATGGTNKNNKEVTTESHRSRDRGSHTAKIDDDKKQISPVEEKPSVTYSSQSAVKSDSHLSRSVNSNLDKKSAESSAESQRTQGRRLHAHSSHVAATSVNKNSSKISVMASGNLSKENSCHTGDKVRHYRRHRSGHHHSTAEKKAVDHHEKKRVADSNLAKSSVSVSNQAEVKSHHCDTDVSCVRSDAMATGENVVPSGNIAVTSSVYTSMPCVLVSNLSSSSSVASPGLKSPEGVTECSDDKKCKCLSDLKDTNVTTTLSLSSTDFRMQTDHNEMDEDAVGHQVLSDLNSNNLSKSSQMLFVVDGKQCNDTSTVQMMSGNANTGLGRSAIPNTEVLHDTCFAAENNDMTVIVPDLSQASPISANFSAESCISPYRESEIIRSPSPAMFVMEEDDHAKEIRSPSPSDRESPSGLGRFGVIETSWDVRLASPCEIQSPDVSDDEAADSVGQFSQHCNVCLHHEPVTIPLTIKEAGSCGMHHH